MGRFAGGSLDDSEKKRWEEQAKLDGFDNTFAWVKWLARNRIKEHDEEQAKK